MAFTEAAVAAPRELLNAIVLKYTGVVPFPRYFYVISAGSNPSWVVRASEISRRNIRLNHAPEVSAVNRHLVRDRKVTK
jgi:hypothetical protein